MEEEIIERLKSLIRKATPIGSLLGKVKSVDKSKNTCVLTDDDTGLDYPDVRLRPVLNGSGGLTVYPKVGSFGLAIRIENDEDWKLIDCTEIEGFELLVGQMKLKLKDSKVTIENGTAVFEQSSSGFKIETSASLKEVIQLVIEAVQATIVTYGSPPDPVKLTQALTKLNLVLK